MSLATKGMEQYGHDLNLREIGQIAVGVKDLERAITFYRDKLGVRHLFTSNGLAFFDCNGIRLMLSVPESPEFDHPSSTIYFKVSDIQSAFTALKERNVQILDQPHLIAKLGNTEIWMAFFRDSENNVHSIMSEVALV